MFRLAARVLGALLAAMVIDLLFAADRTAVAGARKVFWTVLGVAALTVVLVPRAWQFEVPRFALFWADSPPFTLTDFHVTPGSLHVKTGGSVEIRVTMGGVPPDNV